MSTFHERKAERKAHKEKNVLGWKLVKCVACNGSGRYDSNGSPKCSSCEGTGKCRVSPEQYEFYKRLGE